MSYPEPLALSVFRDVQTGQTACRQFAFAKLQPLRGHFVVVAGLALPHVAFGLSPREPFLQAFEISCCHIVFLSVRGVHEAQHRLATGNVHSDINFPALQGFRAPTIMVFVAKA